MTARAQHTLEPWEIRAWEPGGARKYPAIEIIEHNPSLRGSWVIAVMNTGHYVGGARLARANAVRIVACVNALAGMDPEAVAGLVEAVERAQAELDWAAEQLADVASEWGAKVTVEPATDAATALRAALAKVKGGAA